MTQVPSKPWGTSGRVSLRKYPHAEYEEVLVDGTIIGAVWQHQSGVWRAAPWSFPGKENSGGYVYTVTPRRSQDDAVEDVLYCAYPKVWEEEMSIRTAETLDALPDFAVVGNGRNAVWQKADKGKWFNPASLHGLSSSEVLDYGPLILLQRP